MEQLEASFLRLVGNLSLVFFILIIPSTKLFKFAITFLKLFGFSNETWIFIRNSIIFLIFWNAGWEAFIVVREFMKRIFAHKKESIKITAATPLAKPIPAFESPLKDSYVNPSSLVKDNTKLVWSPSGMMQNSLSPLKFSTPSPKLSELVTSPLVNAPNVTPSMILSPSKGVGNGAIWSATLDEQLNRPKSDSLSQNASSKEVGKENVSGAQASKTDHGKSVTLSKPIKFILEREILSPEMSLQYCNLSSDNETYIENVRRWFTRKLLLPLSREISKIDSALESVGLSHLSSRCPANYSMAAKSMDAEILSSHLCLTAPTGFNDAKIQTLNDLERISANDPIVRARLKIEKYLSIALISSHRISLIKRISALADGSFIGSYHHSLSGLSTSAETPSRVDPFDDTQILLHLFCTFMNDNLPSENANDPSPFTSNFFVSTEEKVSNRTDAIQLHQNSLNPITLRVIAEDKILQAHPGHNNLFEAILLLVDYVHRNRRGYLGIGNLDSINIDLISILRK